MAYADDLKHPKWQRTRLEIMSRDQWACSSCHAEDKPLHVHHRRYINGRKPWEYAESDLVTLCDECHKIYHSANDRYTDMQWNNKLAFLEKLISDEATKFKVGPFMIFDTPKIASGCIIFHIPTGYWHGFTLNALEAYSMFNSRPESRQELLQLILQGASARWNE